MKTEQFRINENSDFPGVYIIVNMDNQKVYIGSTRNIRKRLKTHLYSLKKGNICQVLYKKTLTTVIHLLRIL